MVPSPQGGEAPSGREQLPGSAPFLSGGRSPELFPSLTGGPGAAKVISPFFSTAEYSGCCRPSSPAAAFRGAEHDALVKQAFLAPGR